MVQLNANYKRNAPSETRTFAQIADALEMPMASRGVVRACAINPVALVVPCHRVVRGNGGLAGYRWSVERKERLLKLKKARA